MQARRERLTVSEDLRRRAVKQMSAGREPAGHRAKSRPIHQASFTGASTRMGGSCPLLTGNFWNINGFYRVPVGSFSIRIMENPASEFGNGIPDALTSATCYHLPVTPNFGCSFSLARALPRFWEEGKSKDHVTNLKHSECCPRFPLKGKWRQQNVGIFLYTSKCLIR
jgi:hypothetical protein